MEMSKKTLLKTISEAQFAMIECVLFLDTHPCDMEAKKKYEMFRARYETLVKQYEENFGPLTLTADFGNQCFQWVKDPWPWEREAN